MSHAEDFCWVLPPVNNLALRCSHEIYFQANNGTMEFEPSTQLAKIYASYGFSLITIQTKIQPCNEIGNDGGLGGFPPEILGFATLKLPLEFRKISQKIYSLTLQSGQIHQK